MSTDVENPTPLSWGSRPEAVQAWQFMTGDDDEEDLYLRDLAGVEALSHISSLRLTVNTSSTTISHLGCKLPNLQELNLTGSVIESLRDLGTGFQALQVLWVSRCGLPGLDGISALPALRELYAAYNDIADLTPLDCCPLLEVLDVEGNCIDDVESLQALSTACPKLQSLTLAGNPLAATPDYHSEVKTLLHGLVTLDDMDMEQGAAHGKAGLHAEPMRLPQQLSMESPAAAAAAPAPATPAQESELQLVREGIKHARVGVDSAEFRELEMTLLMAAELPADDGPGTSLASSMLPASAGSWLRCSQQGSLPSMQRLRGMRSAEAAAAGAGSSPRTSAGSSSSARCGSGGGGGGSRPSSSNGPPALVGGGGSPKPQRLSTSNARPPSARPGTASLNSNRPSTSAPPTASIGRGLYWRKNRLSGARLHGSGGGSGQDEDDEEGESASSLLTFGVSKAAALGGSLAKDLRRRRHAAPAAAVEVAPLAPSLSAGSSGGGGGGGRLGARLPSYDASSLLEALRQWKVETADRVLLPAEDEASSSAAWPDAEGMPGDGGGDSGEVGHAGGALTVWREAGSEGRGDEESSAEVLRLGGGGQGGAEPEPEAATAAGSGATRSLRSGRSMPAAATCPFSPTSRASAAGAAGSTASPSGKPPLIPLRNGKLPATPPPPPAVVPPPTIPVLGPVQGHRPSRPSKMLLCKVMFETSGRVLLTNHHSLHSVHGSGQESLNIKSRPQGQLGAQDVFGSPHGGCVAEPAPAPDASPAAAPLQRRLIIASCSPEINIRTVNPTPVMHIEDGGDSDSDGDIASMYS